MVYSTFSVKLEQGYQDLKGQISRKYGSRSSNAALHYTTLMAPSVRNLLVEAKGNQRRLRLGIQQQTDIDEDEEVYFNLFPVNSSKSIAEEPNSNQKSGTNNSPPPETKELTTSVSGESSPTSPIEPQSPVTEPKSGRARTTTEPSSAKSEVPLPKSAEVSPSQQKIRSFAVKKNEASRYESRTLKDSDERKRTGSNPVPPIRTSSDADKKVKK
jgi:hypothetical protein